MFDSEVHTSTYMFLYADGNFFLESNGCLTLHTMGVAFYIPMSCNEFRISYITCDVTARDCEIVTEHIIYHGVSHGSQ